MYSRSRRLQNQLYRGLRHARDLYIEQTYAIAGPPGTGVSHYSIAFVPDGLRAAPRLVVLTRNAAIYARAIKAEGDPAIRFDVTYHSSQRPDGTPCQLIDTLEEHTT